MKKLVAFTFCLFTTGLSIAQNTAKPQPATAATTPAGKPVVHKSAIGGYIRDARNRPLIGVQAFVYAADSSINSSGFTDSMGHYETNSTFAGNYLVKIVYPSNKAIRIPGVPIKAGITDISIKANPPEADTTIPYTVFAPKPPEKAKTPKKKADGHQ